MLRHDPGPFASARLVYRAVDPQEDVPFLLDLALDSDAEMAMNPGIPRVRALQSLCILSVNANHVVQPPSRANIEEYADSLVKEYLLSVIICLPPIESQTIAPPVPIGYLTLSQMSSSSAVHRRSNIGINIAAAYRSKGYGGEAIEWALGWGFRRAGLHRIGLGYVAWNAGAGRLYQKLGFVNEGVRRDFFWADDRWWDSVEMSILEGEWRAKNAGT